MGTMSPNELANLWRQDAISVEMAIGHITQNLVHLQGALDAQRQVVQATLEQQRELLLTLQTSLPPAPLPHRATPRKKRGSA
jgi:hypothetical protein